MTGCADCTEPAMWLLDDPGALPVPYCDTHLPHFLRERANAGALTSVVQPEPVEPEPVGADTDAASEEVPEA